MNRFAVALCAVVFAPAFALAGPILQPIVAGSDGNTLFGSLNLLRDQSGLSSGYTSLATDFDAYIASNPTHDGSNGENVWLAFRPEHIHVDFDLGGAHTIESMALWNLGGNRPDNINSVTLYADDNPNFSSPTLLTSFTANPNTGPISAVLAQVITFAPTSASWVRLDLTNFNLAAQQGGFGEAAFEVVPEPTGIACLGAVGLLGALRRRR